MEAEFAGAKRQLTAEVDRLQTANNDLELKLKLETKDREYEMQTLSDKNKALE
jgi:hypothetical protein